MASADGGGQGHSARARVFVDQLMDLKNNKQKHREKAAAEGAQGRLQKWMRQLVSVAGAVEPSPFNAGWDELLQADSTGRWWLVGSAWAGRASAGKRSSSDPKGDPKGKSAEARLLDLAHSQRMNTEVRRSIFVAMMGSEDYLDAHERLTKLRLKKGQQPEVVRVLLECCGQEGVFNRFYALCALSQTQTAHPRQLGSNLESCACNRPHCLSLAPYPSFTPSPWSDRPDLGSISSSPIAASYFGRLAARLCESHREIKFTLHYAFWDEFKALPQLTLHRAANTARHTNG